jgi:hypothetical protein
MGVCSSVAAIDPSVGQGVCTICCCENRLLGYPQCCQLLTFSNGMCSVCIIKLSQKVPLPVRNAGGGDVMFTCPFCRTQTREHHLNYATRFTPQMLVPTTNIQNRPRMHWVKRILYRRERERIKYFIWWPHLYVPATYTWSCLHCEKEIKKWNNNSQNNNDYVIGNLSHSMVITMCSACEKKNYSLIV